MATKAAVCLKIAERSAQQTRALAGALDNARVVTAALEQRIEDLEGEVEQRVRAEREAREEAQEARRFAQRAEDLLANAKQELQKQRAASELSLCALRDELSLLRERDHFDSLSPGDKAVAAEQALREERLRHVAELEEARRLVLVERERALEASRRSDESVAQMQGELTRERAALAAKLEAARGWAREKEQQLSAPPQPGMSLVPDANAVLLGTVHAVDVREKAVKERISSIYGRVLAACNEQDRQYSQLCLRAWALHARQCRRPRAAVDKAECVFLRRVVYGWRYATRGRWRARVVVARWARAQAAFYSLGELFFKWQAQVALGRHLRKQVAKDAAAAAVLRNDERSFQLRIAKERRTIAILRWRVAACLTVHQRGARARAAFFSRRADQDCLLHVFTRWQRALQSRAVPQQASASHEVRRFQRTILKAAAEPLGLAVQSDDFAGRVQAILPGGRLQQHNAAHPQQSVVVGDRIVQANGVMGAPLWGPEGLLHREHNLVLTVERRVRVRSHETIEREQMIVAHMQAACRASETLRYLGQLFTAWQMELATAKHQDWMEQMEDTHNTCTNILWAASLRYGDLQLLRHMLQLWAAALAR